MLPQVARAGVPLVLMHMRGEPRTMQRQTRYEDIVKTTIFLADMADFPKVNEVYGAAFTDQPPARSTVEVSALPKGVRVEIEAIAVRGTGAAG